MTDIADPFIHFLHYTIQTHRDKVEMLKKNKTAATRIRRPITATSAKPHRCLNDGERRCEDGSCIARVELCPEEQLMNQNTILIMIIVGLAVVVFLAILYCFQKRQQRANRQLGVDSGLSEECDNESLYAPPPAYEEVINSNMYPVTPEERRLRQLSLEEPTSPMTPPPNYASALVILAKSQESLSSKHSNVIRRSVSLDQIQSPIAESPRGSEVQDKRRYSKTRNIFRFSRQFSKPGGNNNAKSNESPRTPRSPPPYPQTPSLIPQSPPPPLTPLSVYSECEVQERTTDIEIAT